MFPSFLSNLKFLAAQFKCKLFPYTLIIMTITTMNPFFLTSLLEGIPNIFKHGLEAKYFLEFLVCPFSILGLHLDDQF